jgi:sodium/potassium/calcium exchanger 6
MGFLGVIQFTKSVFLRDIVMFGVLLAVTVGFLIDSKLWDYECALMIVGYMVYLAFIVYNDEGEGIEALEMESDVLSVEDVRSLRIGEVIQVWKQENEGYDNGLGRHHDGDDQGLRKIRSHNQLVVPDRDKLLMNRSVSSDAILHHDHGDIERGDTIYGDNTCSDMESEIYINSHVIRDIPQIIRNDINNEVTELLPHNESISPFYKLILLYILPHPLDTVSIIVSPITIFFNLLIPTIPRHYLQDTVQFEPQLNFKSKLLRFQSLVLPAFFYYMLSEGKLRLIQIIPTTMFLFLLLNFCIPHKVSIPLTGFLASLLLILVTSTYLIAALLDLSKTLHIPHSLLGLTVLTIGNSIGDLVSNLTLAKLGHVDVAMGACVGGPLSYIVLGLGLNGLVVIVKDRLSPGSGGSGRWIELEIDVHFVVSCVFLFSMITVLVVFCIAEWNGRGNEEVGDEEEEESNVSKILDWKVGLFGVCWWILGLGVQIWIEMNR